MNAKLLRSGLIALLLAVQVGAAFLVMLGMRKETMEQVTGHAQIGLEKLAGAVAHQTERFLAPAEATIGVGSRLVSEGLLDASRNRALEGFFLAEMRAKPSINGMFVGRADGSFIFVSRNDEGLLTKTIDIYGASKAVMLTQRSANLDYLRTWVDPQDSYNPRERPWYKLARANAGVSWTGAYRFFSSRSGISAAIAIRYPDGTDAGVLGVDVDIRELSAYIAQVPGAGQGTAALIDEHEHVIGFSDLTRLSQAINGRTLPALTALNARPLESLLAGAQVASTADTAARAAHLFSVGDEQHIGLVRPIAVANGGMSWTMLVQLPVSEFLAPFETAFNKRLRLLMAVLIVTAIIGALALFGLSEPLWVRTKEAGIDPLTGALTRSEFERRLQGMIRGRRESEASGRIYLVALDLDGFDKVNDQYGIEVGDAVLAKFVKRLRRKVRQNDLIARNGGDEFILAVRLDRRADVVATIDRIRAEVVDGAFRVGTVMHKIGVTAGIAGYDADADEALDSLLGRANQALITGKARGRNRCYLAPDHHARWPETVVSTLTAQNAARRRSGSRGQPVE